MATLGNPKNTIAVLQKYQFNFQKKFGQNFLIDTGILEEIIEAAQITKDDFVLEIGPGIGTMTQYLCEAARAVVAVEIDTNLIPILKDTLAEYNNVDVLNEDILKVNISKLAEEKNNGNKRGAIQYLDLQLSFNVTYLFRGEFIVENHHTDFPFGFLFVPNIFFNFFQFTFADVGHRMCLVQLLGKSFHYFRPGCLSQEFQFIEIFVCLTLILCFCDETNQYL